MCVYIGVMSSALSVVVTADYTIECATVVEPSALLLGHQPASEKVRPCIVDYVCLCIF